MSVRSDELLDSGIALRQSFNFNLTVEEIKNVKMMKELVKNRENRHFNDPLSPRADYFRGEIDKLEEKLEEIRDNTLIK